MRKRSWILLALFLGSALPSAAQRSTASLTGTVTDADGAVLVAAQVVLRAAETGFTRTTSTNSLGIYSFADVPAGRYTLDVQQEGFKGAVVSDLVLNVADVRRVDVQLELGALAEEITVTADAVPVETIGGEVAGLVSGEQVRELPLNGRNFTQLTLLMPGVSAPDNFDTKNKGLMTGSDLSVSGGAVTANLWTVDGANNNDVGSN
ncbi:MAG: carboxypeptidase-like regulatory domain-containing protein, partial [Thermoanaerobaculia bacterium]